MGAVLAGAAVGDERSLGETVWRWLCRGLAVVGFAYLLATVGFNAPWGAFVLLLGLFFGPEVIEGQIQVNRRSGDDERL